MGEVDRNNMVKENSNSQTIAIIDRELQMLVITSIHTLKRCKKTCGLEGVHNLVKESLEYEKSIGSFNETLNSLIESNSIIVKTIGNRKCLLLPEENQDTSGN